MSEEQVLAKLRDIHFPAPIHWWPLAPGWYFLMMLILALLGFLLYKSYCSYLNKRAKYQALKLLKSYQQEYESHHNSQLSSMNVSELLRRVALAYFPRDKVAGLQGDAWLEFLNKTSKGLSFTELRDVLLELPYQAEKKSDLRPLFHCAKMWIKQRGVTCSS